MDVHIDESDHCHFFTLEKIGIIMVLYFILFQNSVMCVALYTTLTNFSTKYLVMCKVYTDVGGIK